jgi:fermentation-respiration switch protein FrsA (DUF1100 family)
MRMLLSLVIMIASAYALLAGFLFFAQSHLVYFPQTGRDFIATPEQLGLPYESVTLQTEDGVTLHGWFVPAQAAMGTTGTKGATGTTGTVLFFHGNAGNISHRIDYLSMFHRLGYQTFIFDYRGYGQSSGSPSESGTYIDAQAAWDYLVEERGIPPGSIALFGESLGGAVAAWLAAREHPGLLVLASAFTSLPDMAAKIYPFSPVRLLSRFNYNTLEYLGSVACPVFIAHSPQEEIVPFAHGRALYDAAPEPKEFLELEGGHNGGFIFMRETWTRALSEFMAHSLKAHE